MGIFFKVLLAFVWVLWDRGVMGWVKEDWREGEGINEVVLGVLYGGGVEFGGEGVSMLERDKVWEDARLGVEEGWRGIGEAELGGDGKEEVEVVGEVVEGVVVKAVFRGGDLEVAVEVVVEVGKLRGDEFRGVDKEVVELVGVVEEGVIDRAVFRDDDVEVVVEMDRQL